MIYDIPSSSSWASKKLLNGTILDRARKCSETGPPAMAPGERSNSRGSCLAISPPHARIFHALASSLTESTCTASPAVAYRLGSLLHQHASDLDPSGLHTHTVTRTIVEHTISLAASPDRIVLCAPDGSHTMEKLGHFASDVYTTSWAQPVVCTLYLLGLCGLTSMLMRRVPKWGEWRGISAARLAIVFILADS